MPTNYEKIQEMEKILTQYNNLKQELENLKNEKSKEIREGFFDYIETTLSEILQNVELDSISWTAYTPYFNDGDACIYRIGCDFVWEHKPYVKNLWMYQHIHTKLHGGSLSSTQKEIVNELEQLPKEKFDKNYMLFLTLRSASTFINSLDTELFLMTFGDHKHFTFSKGVLTVDDYEHE